MFFQENIFLFCCGARLKNFSVYVRMGTYLELGRRVFEGLYWKGEFFVINAFLLIGQSNMAGRGYLQGASLLDHPDILMFRDGKWQQAHEPVHQDRSFAEAGLCMSFADTLRQDGRQIGVIPCAMGGSALDEWKPGDELFENACRQTEQAVQEGAVLKGFLWHQGEADSEVLETAETYCERFLAMISEMRRRLHGEGLPVVLGELGEYLENREGSPYWKEVNAQIHQIADGRRGFAVVSSEGLKDRGDILHFDTPSLRIFGVRYAQAWKECAAQLGISLE